MIRITELNQHLKHTIEGPIIKSAHEFTDSVHGLGTVVFQVHPEFEDIFVYSTDIDEFKSDDIYPLLPKILSSEIHKLTSISLEKFGNVAGPLYVNSTKIDVHKANMFVSSLTNVPISSFPQAAIDQLEKIANIYKYDASLALDRVKSMKPEDFKTYQTHKFSVENLNIDSAFDMLFSFFYDSLHDSDLPLDWKSIFAFITAVRSHYNCVPYHNWRHAIDATQFVYYLISIDKIKQMLQPLDRFSLLLGVLCHDLEHNGRTNDFHRKVNSKFAQESGPDLPPLEYHHECLAKEMIKKIFAKTLSEFSEEMRNQLFTFIQEIILSTDMSKHKMFVDKITENVGKFDGSIEMRLLACQAVMKLADLSNTCRLFEDSEFMAKQLTEEWFQQGEDETKHGLQITKGFDRNNPTPLPQGQIGFYKFCTKQLLDADNQFFGCLEDIVNQFNSNLSKWEELAKNI